MKRLFHAFLGFLPFFALIVPLKPQSESADQELNFENYYKYVPYEADKLQFQSAVSSKIHISTAKSFPIELLSAYTFYHYDVGVRNYYVADVLNPDCFSQNIVQLIIIDKADEADKIDSSLEGKSIIRISRFVDGRLYVKDSPISERLVQDISKISRTAEDGSEEFKTTVTSLNLIFDLEKDIARNLEEANLSQPQAVDVLPGGPILPPIFPPISKYEYLEPLPDEIEVADNQATLDYYLSIKDIFGQITVNYANTIFPNPKRNSMTFFDDPITTIIPKKYFENPGVATVVGKEFGYCIETVNNLSSVLVFDITHTISKNDSGITIGIVPVIHSNYVFDETKNTVFQGAPNNLCLANPSLTAQIRYLNLEDDANSVKHPNPGDIDYVQSEDNGAYFSSFMSKIKGKSQKYEIDEVLSTLKYVVGNAFLKVHIDYQKTTDVSYAFMVSEEGLLEIDPHVNYINPNFIIEIENVTTGQKKTAVNGSLSIEVNPDCLYNLIILYGAYTDLESSIIQMILI